jgi:gamma-glutamyltranspeptidase / glutathione hydrolase
MPPLDWHFPYPSQRMPVFARNVVATSQPLAAQVGLQVLRDGGNAADAAVATAAAMAVIEPSSNGLGADAFTLIWQDGKLHGLNASGRAPKAVTPDQFAGRKEMPKLGWGPVTVPGAVSAWAAVSKRFGKLPFERLLAPAIEYAERGFPVAPQTADLWAKSRATYREFPEFLRVFFPDGREPAPGRIFRNPDQAGSLRKIADTKGEAYYRGELAERIVAHARATGGTMTADDLASHTADWVEPISQVYRGHRLHEIPPNGQGLAALIALGILQHRDIGHLDPDCPDVLHLQIEAMKLAFADAHRYIADPKSMDVKPEQLLDPAYLAERAKEIDPDRAKDPKFGTPKPGGTILLTAADASGMMVSFIQSNYLGFGSGVVVPGTGIHFQNRGACFTLEKGHPNQVGGGKRPYHTIIPGFVTVPGEDGKDRPLMAFGVMGGFMQPQGHLQVISRIVDFHQNPQAALDACRWQVMAGMRVAVEPGFAPSIYDELRRRGHELELATHRTVIFGGGQVIYRMEDAYCGASDLRRDGQAVGF